MERCMSSATTCQAVAGPSPRCEAALTPATAVARCRQLSSLARSPTAALHAHLASGACSYRCRARRSLSVTAGRTAVTEPWWEKNNPPNMKAINSVQELVDEMAAAGDKLVILDFYAKWCNACRALFPKLCQLASDNPDIIVLKIDWDENKPICKALSVKVLPFFHFYRGALGRVAAFSASVSKVQRLRDALAEHNTPRCSLGEVPAMAEFPNYTPGGGAVQRDQAEADVQAVVAAQRADLQANSAQPEPSQPQQPAADSAQWRAPQSQFRVAQLGGYGGNIVVSSPRSKAVKEREADAAAV